MVINTHRWNRLRYTIYAPFYDVIARRLERGRCRALELLRVRVLRPGGRGSVFDKFAMGRASPVRRALNVITNLLATDITRSMPAILAHTNLTVVREEPSAFGGIFRVAIVERSLSFLSPDGRGSG